MPETLSLSREAIRTVYNTGPEAEIDLVEGILEQFHAMEARVQELEDRLSKDSHNSGKPPLRTG